MMEKEDKMNIDKKYQDKNGCGKSLIGEESYILCGDAKYNNNFIKAFCDECRNKFQKEDKPFVLEEKIIQCKSEVIIFPDLFYAYDVKEFIRILQKAGDENDWDIMIEDGEDGDITVSFNEWLEDLAGPGLVEGEHDDGKRR